MAILLSILFFSLALLHFYWALGGQWGLSAALPTKDDQETALSSGPLACIIVGLGLMAFGLFYFLKIELLVFELPQWLHLAFTWGIPSLFLIRAIGDFNYVGFAKKVKHTYFAQMDSRYFSPLCLAIAVMGYLSAFCA